ncbi:MAG TPA: TIGR02466 family protein [Planctomycetota bacterium]|nr:TIGR02466 family protein [Planctomycetota bacterium]
MNEELAIDTPFPLAVGRVLLQPDPLDTARMMQQALAWRGKARSNPEEHSAWTGDINGIWQVHRHPSFAWLTAAVQRHVRAFCARLGFDPAAVAFQFQRSWPVVSEPGQAVDCHHHPNAHVSCVYYLNGDGSGDAGVLRLYPPHYGNELVPGVKVKSPYNQPSLDIAPEAGLLVIFPSRTDHAVTSNESADLRFSISMDIHLSAPLEAGPNPLEFLAPDPRYWDPFAPPERPAKAAAAKRPRQAARKKR